MSSKKFKSYIPVDLVKSEEDGEWNIQGIASTEDPDLQGEKVLQDGLDISALKAGKGLFNWDHHKGPENILGSIEDAEFVDHDGKKALLVKGYLFKETERARAFYNILKSLKKGASPRVHMSIEGKILERDFSDKKTIRQARIDKVALTMDPVNPNTFTTLAKSLAADKLEDNDVVKTVEEIEETVEISKKQLNDLLTAMNALIVKNEGVDKALMAGAGGEKAPEARADGEAMTKESLDKEAKIVTHQESKKKSRKAMIKSVIDDLRKSHPNVDPLDLTEWVLEMFMHKLDSKEKSND